MFFFVRLLMFFWVGGIVPLMAQNSPIELKSCWALWNPYQYEVFVEGQKPYLIGLDIKLAQKTAQIASMHISYEMMTWENQLKALKEGTKDLANGALYSQERAKDYHYSISYRHEQRSLFFLRDNPLSIQFKNIDEMLEQFKEKKFRLGTTTGEYYPDKNLADWINNPDNQAQIVKGEDDSVHLQNLLQGKIDGFLADRLSGATNVWSSRKGSLVTEMFIEEKKPVYFIFSKKTVSLETVEKFNNAIRELQKSSDYKQIIKQYLPPDAFFERPKNRDMF